MVVIDRLGPAFAERVDRVWDVVVTESNGSPDGGDVARIAEIARWRSLDAKPPADLVLLGRLRGDLIDGRQPVALASRDRPGVKQAVGDVVRRPSPADMVRRARPNKDSLLYFGMRSRGENHPGSIVDDCEIKR